MIDWTKSMQQTFEYYLIDPETWSEVKQLDYVKSCDITRDLDVDTLGSATIDSDDVITDECYVRVYLVAIQNGNREKVCLGTFLVQPPSLSFDGIKKRNNMDAYTPLIELTETYPDIGYYIPKGEEALNWAYKLANENMRAPVIKPHTTGNPLPTDFVSDPSEHWLKYLKDLVGSANHIFMLDETGRVMFMPKQDTDALQPVWTYDDGNTSILHPDIEMENDIYGIPNVVEVVCATDSEVIRVVVENNDITSPISIPRRGRKIVHRETDPSITGSITKARIEEYASNLLKELSSVECTVSYAHGYCPVRVGDCVLLNYSGAGLNNIKAKVISQNISCTPSCPVSEKAVFTKKLWR